MGTAFGSPALGKLYALLLRLRPVQRGTLMPFSGELVHGAFHRWLKNAAPDVATWLHDGNKPRLFTCSSLQFPLPRQQIFEAERGNVYLPLEPEKTYTVRITLLLGELLPLFQNALMRFNSREMVAKKSPFMQIGKQLFTLEEVISNNDDAFDWTGSTSFADLVEGITVKKLGGVEPLRLEFATLTTFNRGNQKNRAYGNHYARLPLPQYVFPFLAKRWQELAPPELTGIVQKERVEAYALDEGVIINDYDLKPHMVKFTTHRQEGFIGTCKYLLRGPDEPTTDEVRLTMRQQILLLGQLAFYTGVGYKTAMGMGRVRSISG